MPIPHSTPTPIEGETPGSVANLPGCEAQEFVGAGREGLSDSEREAAIERAARLVEFFMAESSVYEALWRRYSGFEHKGEADAAKDRAQAATRLMEALIRGRRPEFVAWLERQRGLDLPACANEERRG
jgi:hypothetical protein